MRSQRRDLQLAAGIFCLVAVVFLAACVDERLWAALGVHHVEPYFSDLVAVLAAGDAQQAGLDIYARINPFDPFGRPHVYGPWWTLARLVGLTKGDAWWLGLLLAGCFVAVAILLLRPRKSRDAVIVALFLCAPPVLLGLERGNNDLVIFLLVAFAGWMANRASGAVASASLMLAAALKIYPLAALPALAAGKLSRRAIAISLACGVLACAAIAGIWWREYRAALALAPRPTTIFAYGFDVSIRTWAGLPELHRALACGFAVTLAGGGAILWHERAALWQAVPARGTSAALFVSGAAMWCLCYAVTINYPYRLVLVCFLARLWLEQRSGAFGRVARRQVIGWLIVLWATVPKRWLAMGSVDRPSGGWPTCLALFVGCEQALVLVLTAALAIALTGWLARQVHGQLADTAES